MLSRVARQKNALFHLRRSNRSLLATPRPHSHSSRPTPIIHSFANDQHERPRQPSFRSNRNLATAADQSAVDQTGSYLPFEDSSYSAGRDYNHSSPWASLFPSPPTEFDPSSLIIVDDFLQTRPKVTRNRRTTYGGDEDEMLANLDISLKVGQFDRAASLITRLGVHFPVGSPEYLAINNRYLEAMVSNMILTRDHALTWPLQRWFEVDMPSANVEPDAATFAIMVKMALRMLHGTKRDRTVRRYWQLAKDQGAEEELLAVPILSELELGELSEICSSDLQRVTIDNPEFEPAQNPHASAADHDVPRVRPVAQKGLGLASLQDSLSLFLQGSDIPYPSNAGLSPEERKEIYDQQRQQRLESDAIRSAMERWHKEFENLQKAGVDVTAGGKRLGPMLNQWHTDLVSRIKEELKLVAEAESTKSGQPAQKERREYGIFLRTLEPDQLAALTILSVLGAFSKQGMERGLKLVGIAMGIGREIQEDIIAREALQKSGVNTRRRNMLKKIFAGRKDKEGRMRWQTLVRKLQIEDPTVFWPPSIVAKVGAVLLSFLFEVGRASVETEEPGTGRKVLTKQAAFHHSYQITWGRRQGLIHLHPEIVQIIAKEPPANLLSRHLPMLCKPKLWKGVDDGGYLLYKSNIVRTTPGETLQPAYLKAAMENNGLEQVRTALDILGTTPWCINREVFDVMLEAWNSGEAIGNLAALEPEFHLPPKPAPEEGYSAEMKWHQRLRDIENQRSGNHSVRCFQNFQLELARAFRDEEFYLPHNLDFRGRAYPLPPYINQMGADNARALLLFSEAKPLGESGLKWLKVQIANLYGFDKASISEREQFAMDHLDDIIDSADKGLHGKRWWLHAEDAWQCLAACCELRNAYRLPDPTMYASRLPIHQDGSCNGLQHYAALGGDTVGAQQVNLEPSDRPSDVYTGVAEWVKDAIARDAVAGDPRAQLLESKVSRKIVKQTVMTNVYGVTFLGAMKQVRKQLIDHYPELPSEEHNKSSFYIAKKIFEALSTMFSGAHEIQYWLGDCASRITQSLSPDQIEDIAKEALSDTPLKEREAGKKRKDLSDRFKTTVIWTTPLGLPVVQPYRTRKSRRVSTTMQHLSLVDGRSDNVVNRRKQLQAFPPNFIHSLDATHMMLSALACRKAGLTFSAVHDSFWTHASDVDSMNRVLREAFVRMHSDDIVKRLAEEFKVRFGNNMFLTRVRTNSKIGNAIARMRKAKSKRPCQTQELLDEYRRQKLLKSEDPELQAQGRAMVTAAAIFEQMGGTHDDLGILNSLGEQHQVGHVPEDLATAERRPERMGLDASDPAIESLMPDLAMTETNPAPNAAPAASALAEVPESETPMEEEEEEEAPKKKKKQLTHYTWLWLPVWFRDVPKKGEWDLTRIRNSQYFFS